MTLLLRMVTGSRLYGTHRPDSDWDRYEIHDKIKASHKLGGVRNDQDVMQWSLSLFMKVAAKGGHNALDLMFADPGWPEVDLIPDLRASFVADPYNAHVRFSRTIQSYLDKGTPKGLMNAQRLSDNLDSIWKTGRYNPRWR